MKQQIRQILQSCPRNSRRKHLTKEMIEWLELQFPDKDFSYQCYLILSDDPIPKCAVCGNLPDRGKTTCSRKCREKLKKQIGESAIDKMRKSMIELYGVDNPAKMEETQKKRIATNIKKYGQKVSPTAIESARERALVLNTKGRETLQNRYGVSNPSQIENHREKCKATLRKNYGVDNYFESDEWREKQRQRQCNTFSILVNSHADIVKIHTPSLDLQAAYKNPNCRIEIRCQECHKEEILTTETIKYRLRTFGEICSRCLGVNNKGSIAENQIADFLEHYVDVDRNNRTLIAPQELDIVIKDRKLAIEYCGLYWHNDKRVAREYHSEKLAKCKENGYDLITIFEDEWLHKRDIVKARLLHKLGLIGDKIYARKTICKPISAAQARSFCDQFHIQGYHNASVNYGLFDQGRIVSVMTFRNGDASKKQKGWELSRFCSQTDVVVVGGASKLFKRFVKDFNPSNVITFSDLRWNNGKVYESLGFKFKSVSPINYWYIDATKRRHRFSLKKPADSILTEFQLRDQEGWNRIWDCGNAKYVWINNHIHY